MSHSDQPNFFKEIVCLANSRKPSGRCIAGKELLNAGQAGAWIRPVSNRDSRAVSEWERQYEDGSDPRLLDVVELPLIRHSPDEFQQENWLLDPRWYWVKRGAVDASRAMGFIDRPQRLWLNGFSTQNGVNDRIPQDLASSITNSLTLVDIPDFEIRVHAPGRSFGDEKRRVQAIFEYGDVEYRLRITDPRYERWYLAKRDGIYSHTSALMTVSLGDVFEGFTYKLVAAIIPKG